MSDSVVQATASLQRWFTAFNACDVEGMIADTHFPHRRLSGENDFELFETADDFRANHEKTLVTRNAQGWGYNTAKAIEGVQSGPDKVHLAFTQSRCRPDGTEYHAFPTLWIFTKIDGRWGVQFRSSFLSGSVERGEPVE